MSRWDRRLLSPLSPPPHLLSPPLTTHHSPLTTHHSPLTTHYSPLTTYTLRQVKPPSTHRVCQVYASALPVAYAKTTSSADWAPFARLVLRATYEAGDDR